MDWRPLAKEPTLDDLLGDEMMIPVARSAGLEVTELKRRTVELARRLARGAPPPPVFTSASPS